MTTEIELANLKPLETELQEELKRLAAGQKLEEDIKGPESLHKKNERDRTLDKERLQIAKMDISMDADKPEEPDLSKQSPDEQPQDPE